MLVYLLLTLFDPSVVPHHVLSVNVQNMSGKNFKIPIFFHFFFIACSIIYYGFNIFSMYSIYVNDKCMGNTLQIYFYYYMYIMCHLTFEVTFFSSAYYFCLYPNYHCFFLVCCFDFECFTEYL